MQPRLAPRLARLPSRRVGHRRVRVAVGIRARLLGLALLPRERAGAGLLIPRCAAVHTFGMRFPLDLRFLDGEGRLLAVHHRVPPRRLRCCRGARAVLEVPSAEGEGSTRAPTAARSTGVPSAPGGESAPPAP